MSHDPKMKKTLALFEFLIIFFFRCKREVTEAIFFLLLILSKSYPPHREHILWLMFLTSALCRPSLKKELKKKKKKKEKAAGSHLVRPQNGFNMKDQCTVSEDDVLNPRALTLLKRSENCLSKHPVI